MLVIAGKMYNILKGLVANGYWSRDDGGSEWSKFLLEPALQHLFFY